VIGLFSISICREEGIAQCFYAIKTYTDRVASCVHALYVHYVRCAVNVQCAVKCVHVYLIVGLAECVAFVQSVPAQCVAVCCSLYLHSVCCIELECVAASCSEVRYVAVYYIIYIIILSSERRHFYYCARITKMRGVTYFLSVGQKPRHNHRRTQNLARWFHPKISSRDNR